MICVIAARAAAPVWSRISVCVIAALIEKCEAREQNALFAAFSAGKQPAFRSARQFLMKSETSTDALSSMSSPAPSNARMFSKRQSFAAPVTCAAAALIEKCEAREQNALFAAFSAGAAFRSARQFLMKSETSTDALSSMSSPAPSNARMFSKRQSFIAPARRSAAPAREQTLRMVMLNVSSGVAWRVP